MIIMMLFVICVLATLLSAAWLVLLGRVNRDDWIEAAYVKVLDNQNAVKILQDKDTKTLLTLSGHEGIMLRVIKTVLAITGGDSKKKIKKLQKEINQLQKGDLRSVNIFIMPGYVLQREVEAIGKGSFHKSIMAMCFELYGKKHASKKTTNLLAKLLSYPVAGVSCTLAIGVMLLGSGNATIGLGIIGIGTILVLVLVYSLYDQLKDLVSKRRISISKQFPNAVSKLALLVTSGMIMDRAWKETSMSHDSELYMEMRKTSSELENLVSPESAYGNFINRCNTKESAKLASAILQNLSKGNAEIGRLLKDMAREAWQERRHMAKREAEKANSKLMIPTMLLFLAILVMLMVPVAMNFSGI